MLENSTAPFFTITEGLSYDAESATSKEFSKEKSPERFQLGMQI